MIFPRRIYDLGLSHKAVAVYCYLANRADKNGECFPSVRRIAEDLSIHKSTVYRAFTELENRGLLERIPRYHIQGGRRSSLYRVKGEITKVQAQINDTELQARLTTLQQKEGVLENFQSYKNSIANAELMYNYMPKGTTTVYKMLREPFTAKQDKIENVTSDDIRKNLNGMKLIDTVEISGYTVSATFTCTNQAQPSQYVRALIAQGYFENISYTGYEVEKGEDNKETVTFSLSMLLKAGNDITIDKDSANSIIENNENGDQGAQDNTSSAESSTESTSEASAQ